MSSDLLPWWDHVDWLNDPQLAYLKGLQDGVQLGRDAVDRELCAALAEALSAGATTDYATAVGIHHRAQDQRQRREAADTPITRVGDFPGAQRQRPAA